MTSTTNAPARVVPLSSKGIDVRKEGVDGSRWYRDPATDRLLQSVTTVIGGTTSMPWLTPWAAKLAAEAAVENLELVTAMVSKGQTEAAVEYIKGEGKRRREAASEAGTWLHDVVEAIALDSSLPEFPDTVVPFADAFLDWCCEWEPVFLMSECTVANPARGYAGTLDLGVRFPCFDGTPYEGNWLLDAKSGANLSAYMPVQLKAYAEATEVWLPQGQKTAMPRIDHIGVLHVRPGGVKLIDVTDQADASAFHTFLRMLELMDWKDAQGGRMGRALYLPDAEGNQPPPLLEDLDDVPARAALAGAGIFRLDQLAQADADALSSLKGVGPKALVGLRDLLASHKLPVSERLQTMCDDLQEADRLKRDKAEVKHARTHLFQGERSRGCDAEGVGGPGTLCRRSPEDHETPAPKTRASRKAAV